MPPLIINPYREFTESAWRHWESLSHEERIEILKEAGILDKQGRLAALYRGPRERKPTKTPTKPKLARPKSAKTAKTRKRAAS